MHEFFCCKLGLLELSKYTRVCPCRREQTSYNIISSPGFLFTRFGDSAHWLAGQELPHRFLKTPRFKILRTSAQLVAEFLTMVMRFTANINNKTHGRPPDEYYQTVSHMDELFAKLGTRGTNTSLRQ